MGVGPLSELASETTAPLKVLVYCASIEGIDPRHVRLAADVGTGIAARGWELVSGGGKRSMMGAVASAARARFPLLPVLYMSGWSEEGMLRGGRLDPDLDLMPKPFTREILARRVRRALDGTHT